MRKLHGRHGVAWVMIAVCLLSAPLAAQSVPSDQCSTLIVGADGYGSPSWPNGSRGGGKVYRDSRTGIRILIALAIVRNQSGRGRSFFNLGLSILDLGRRRTFTSTSDFTLLSRPLLGCSLGSCIAVYNPNSTPI
jgi:hypothetical protein